MKILATLILALGLCSCSTTLPPGSSITVGTGKQTVAIETGGKTFQEALKEAGRQALAVGGRVAVNLAVNFLENKLRAGSGK